MYIYHSYGSSYQFKFAFKSLKEFFKQLLCLNCSRDNSEDERKLKDWLENYFSGQALLVYKGRHAITLALKSLGVGANDLVFTQAFSCHAVEAGILQSGAKIQYVDVADNSNNLSLKTLEKARQKYSSPKALIVQHSLGVVAPMREISSWCRQHNVLLLEDVAQSLGGMYKDQQVGSWADAVICSFGRDKIIDAVAGGAVILKTPNQMSEKINLNYADKSTILKDLFFPFLMFMIRSLDRVFIGKVIYQFSKRIGLLSSPIMTRVVLPSHINISLCRLSLERIQNLSAQLLHRRKIAKIYFENLKKYTLGSLREMSEDRFLENVFLRFPIVIEDPDSLSIYLKKYKIFLSDRWYRAAVDAGSLNFESVYQHNSCPNAQILSQKVFNLPTHELISEKKAIKLSEIVRDYLESYSHH